MAWEVLHELKRSDKKVQVAILVGLENELAKQTSEHSELFGFVCLLVFKKSLMSNCSPQDDLIKLARVLQPWHDKSYDVQLREKQRAFREILKVP